MNTESPPMAFAITMLSLTLLAAPLAGPVAAQVGTSARVPPGQRRQIDLRAAPGNQQNPAVAFNSTQDEFLVLWEQESPSSIEGRIVRRRPPFDRSSVDLEPPFLVDAPVGLLAKVPSAAYNATENTYLVVWEESDFLETVGTLMGARLSAEGDLLGVGVFRIDTGPCVDDDPSVAWNSQDNQWMVVWHEDDSGSCDQSLDGINGRLVNPDGGFAGPVFNVSPDSAVSADEPFLSYDSVNNEYLAVYERQDGAPTVQLGQRLSASGAPLGPELSIATQPGLFQEDSSIAFDPVSGQHLVAWQLRQPVLNTLEFVLARFVAGGTGAMGPVFQVSDGETDGNHPGVAYDPRSGQFLVIFDDRRDPVPLLADIRGQWVNPDGTLFGGNFVIGARAGSQNLPQEVHRPVACGTDGWCLATWADDAPPTDDNDIAGRLVFPSPAAAVVTP